MSLEEFKKLDINEQKRVYLSIKNKEKEGLEKLVHRCQEDVKINIRLFIKQMRYMRDLYGEQPEVVRFLRYLMFKANCATHQLKSRWKLDVERCVATLEDFKSKKEEKVLELIEIMPKIPVMRVRKYPRQMLKKDGTYTVAGQAWVDTLKERWLPDTHTEDIVYIHSYLDPNPNSPLQIKVWLYDLGWKPETFKYIKEDNGDVRKVEQVRTEGAICDSVKKLMKKEPRLDALEGLTVLSHRIGMLQGFLNNASPDGYIRAEVQGLTNTLRFRHKVAVNLPGVTGKGDISDGAHIRGCLIAPEGYELCGSDMSSLEDRTKQHFMWKYDPEYVKEMMVDDFDPHMSLAQFASALTQEDIDLFHDIKKRKKKGDEILKEILTRFDKISGIRHEYKTANYACVYGAGIEALARGLNISKKRAANIIEAYWKRNWSVKKVAEDCKVKTVNGQKWLFNPISRFWYSLRYDKDRFSTLNQGSGVYCFDTWIKYIVSKGKWPIGQFHDEIVLCVKKGYREQCEKLLKWAIGMANKELRLNRELDIDVQFSDTYAGVH